MIRFSLPLQALLLAMQPVWAEERPRPAPEYFLQMVLATTTAQQLALACPSLSFEIVSASRDSGAVLSQLEADGFDGDLLEEQMVDPTPIFEARQAAFLAKHGLTEGAAQERVCAAGVAEIADGSAIGTYLVEVTP